jgi:hypothetical protein
MIYIFDIIQGVVFKELQFGDDPELVMQVLSKVVPELLPVMPDQFQQSLFIAMSEDAEVYLGYGKILADMHLGDRDHGAAEKITGFPQKSDPKLLLDHPVDFLLSHAVHGTKI